MVVTPILDKHYRRRHFEKHHRNAQAVSELLEGYTLVRYQSERGDLIDTVYEASMRTGITEFVRPYVRMYVMQLARFFARLFSELTYAAYRSQADYIPHLSEFCAIFQNRDDYFRQRKTWSIYRP